MTERSYFYDSTEDQKRIYSAADFARFHAQIIGNGVSNDPDADNLSVDAKEDMKVKVGTGYAFANGYMYENDSALTLEHDIADPDHDRIDRIVIRFDSTPTEREAYASVVKGVAGKSPKAPEIVRDEHIFELSVAQVRIKAGKSYLETSQITDERGDEAVCGYIPLYNLYRGLQISKDGIVSMLNQSFVKTENRGSTGLENRQHKILPFGDIVEDTQNEVSSGNTFTPKSDGVYNLWVMVGFEEGGFPDNLDVHVHLVVNGTRSFPMEAKVLSSANDNFIIASGVDRFKKGDHVQFSAIIYRAGDADVSSNRISSRIAKIA